MTNNLKALWLKAWAAGERGQWLYGLLGRLSADGTTVTVTVPHRTDYVYVRMGPNGDQGIAEVKTRGNVALRPGLPVRMRVDSGVLTLYETDVALMGADPNAPDDGSGVAYHLHTFTALTDTPTAYTGEAGKLAQVNAGETAVEFVEPGAKIAATIHAATLDATPLDADEVPGLDSSASFALVRWTWTTVKAFLKTYFDTLYNLYVHPNHTGDVTSVGDGATTIAADAVTYAKMQNVSATDKVLGRSTAGAGNVEEIAMTAAGRALVDDADATAQRTTLGLGTMAVEAATAFLRLLGVAGGQTAYGGTAANEDLTLEGTSHATKTTSYVLLQPGGGKVGINTNVVDDALQIGNATARARARIEGNEVYALGMKNGTGGTYAWMGVTAAGAYQFSDAAGNPLFTITQAGLIGLKNVTAPQGPLHLHDGTGGKLFVTKTGVAGTAVTVIPNGTGDVTVGLTGMAYAVGSGGAKQVTTLAGFASEGINPGESVVILTDGASVFSINVAADGSVTLTRAGGTVTATVLLHLLWL